MSMLIFVLLTIPTSVLVLYTYSYLNKESLLYKCGLFPETPVESVTVEYWGSGKEKPDDKTIKPFEFHARKSDLIELKEKLQNTRELVPPLEGVGFNYGFNTNYVKEFINYWQTNYNWTEREKYLNSFPQFTTEIGGLRIHFLHVKIEPSKLRGRQIVPLLILHGWPGAVKEFFKILPMLTNKRLDADFVFEPVIPSLPGHTFSEAASKPGLSSAHMGALFNELMARLGHDEYYIHGGDWGSAIGQSMSIQFPKNVRGFHSTFCLASTFQSRIYAVISYIFPNLFVEDSRRKHFSAHFITDMFILESGYLHIQSTKPDTLGVALSDSPIGLAAYILEKFSTWTNKDWRYLADGGLENMNKEDLIDSIMLYWLTKSITTSMRIYSESFNKKNLKLAIEERVSTVPTACAWFQHELIYYPKICLEAAYKNLVQVSHFDRGGHFSAYEEPMLVSNDLWKFVKTVRKSSSY